MNISNIQGILIGLFWVLFASLLSGHSSSRGKRSNTAPWHEGMGLRTCLSMMTILVYPGHLLKLTMPAAAAAVEEDHPNSKNETHHTKGWKSSYSTRFSLQLVMHARGTCHEDDKETSKENGWGSQPNILKYLGLSILLKLRQQLGFLKAGLGRTGFFYLHWYSGMNILKTNKTGDL